MQLATSKLPDIGQTLQLPGALMQCPCYADKHHTQHTIYWSTGAKHILHVFALSGSTRGRYLIIILPTGQHDHWRNIGANLHAKCWRKALCDAGRRIMQQLSSTISPGDQTNAIVLPLHVYSFLLAISRLLSFLTWSKASSHSFLPLYLPDTLCITLWVGGWVGGQRHLPTEQQHWFLTSIRWGGILLRASLFPQTSLCHDKIRAHTRTVSAGVRTHHQCGSAFNILSC